MQYNFDIIHNRKNTRSVKHSNPALRNYPEDALPLWVADMDFQTPVEVRETIIKQAEHGIFGYASIDEDYISAVTGWQKKHFGWDIAPEWLVPSTGVVNAIAVGVLALTDPGDKILIQRPVYFPFFQVIEGTGREVVNSPLVLKDGRYEIDFADFEQKIIDNQPKMFILCSPHNPGGRVWSKEELMKMGNICTKHGVYVFSDEIHQDFIWKGAHHNFANLKPTFAEISITSTAPSKTFNIPGLHTANNFIPNKTLREKFVGVQNYYAAGGPNNIGIFACEAAYTYGQLWLDQLKVYLQNNIAYIDSFLKSELPQIKLMQPEGTYLLWIDFSELGLAQPALDDFISNKAKLWLNTGTMFGPEGEGFMRMNVGCPKSVLEEAMRRLKEAYKTL